MIKIGMLHSNAIGHSLNNQTRASVSIPRVSYAIKKKELDFHRGFSVSHHVTKLFLFSRD